MHTKSKTPVFDAIYDILLKEEYAGFDAMSEANRIMHEVTHGTRPSVTYNIGRSSFTVNRKPRKLETK